MPVKLLTMNAVIAIAARAASTTETGNQDDAAKPVTVNAVIRPEAMAIFLWSNPGPERHDSQRARE